MNSNIAQLARHPRGKPYRSRLTAFDEEIRTWRAADISYRDIVGLLADRGLNVSHAAVHGYVRARAKGSKNPAYSLPATATAFQTFQAASDTAHDFSSPTGVDNSHLGELISCPKHIYIPTSTTTTIFSEADLDFNDPLAL